MYRCSFWNLAWANLSIVNMFDKLVLETQLQTSNLSILNIVINLVADTQLPQLTRLMYEWHFHSELDICGIKPSTMHLTETNKRSCQLRSSTMLTSPDKQWTCQQKPSKQNTRNCFSREGCKWLPHTDASFSKSFSVMHDSKQTPIWSHVVPSSNG